MAHVPKVARKMILRGTYIVINANSLSKLKVS